MPGTASACPLSVCVPAFNGGRYLGATLASVLAQSFEDFELLVVDDASTDGTHEIAAAVKDPRVRVVGHRVRLGLVANWNHCLELSRGRLVTVFHQDDLMAPDNLERKVRFLEAEPTVGFVHSGVRQVDAEGRRLSDHWSEPSAPDDEGRHDGLVYYRRLVAGGNPVCAPSVVMRREACQRVGGFDPRLPFTADWAMWMRLALFHDVGYLARPLVTYRRHESMETARIPWSRQLEQGYLAKMRVLDEHADRVPDADALREGITREYGERAMDRMRQALEGGRPLEAAEYLAVALGIRARARDGTGEAVSAILDALAAEELAHTLAEHDRTITAMAGTRIWRAAQSWWTFKRAAGTVLRRR